MAERMVEVFLSTEFEGRAGTSAGGSDNGSGELSRAAWKRGDRAWREQRGYRSYRGRGTKRKILLALLLCLVILAAVMVILVQEHVVFDANGTPRLEIPWQKEEPEQTPELDLVIEEPEAPWQVRAYQVTTAPLTVEGWEQARMKVLASSDSYVALAAMRR